MATTATTTSLTQSILPRIERWRFWRTWFGAWLRTLLGIGRRFGVRYTVGNEIRERTGFMWKREAERWMREHAQSGVVYDYEPAVDLRLRADSEHAPDRFSDRPDA